MAGMDGLLGTTKGRCRRLVARRSYAYHRKRGAGRRLANNYRITTRYDYDANRSAVRYTIYTRDVR